MEWSALDDLRMVINGIGVYPALKEATFDILRNDEAFLTILRAGTIFKVRHIVLHTMIQINERLVSDALYRA